MGVLPKTGCIAPCIHFPRNKLYNFGSFLCSYLSHLGYFAESDIFLTANAEKPLPGETASIQLELIFLGLEKVAQNAHVGGFGIKHTRILAAGEVKPPPSKRLGLAQTMSVPQRPHKVVVKRTDIGHFNAPDKPAIGALGFDEPHEFVKTNASGIEPFGIDIAPPRGIKCQCEEEVWRAGYASQQFDGMTNSVAIQEGTCVSLAMLCDVFWVTTPD